MVVDEILNQKNKNENGNEDGNENRNEDFCGETGIGVDDGMFTRLL